jgi:hypothetical protein
VSIELVEEGWEADGEHLLSNGSQHLRNHEPADAREARVLEREERKFSPCPVVTVT